MNHPSFFGRNPVSTERLELRSSNTESASSTATNLEKVAAWKDRVLAARSCPSNPVGSSVCSTGSYW